MSQGFEHVTSTEKTRFDVATGTIALSLTIPLERIVINHLSQYLQDDPDYNEGYHFENRVLYRNAKGERAIGSIPKIQTMLSVARFAQINGVAPPQNSHKLNPRIVKSALPVRDSGLDELPQVRAIATGQFSWVGPRPCGEKYLDEYLDKAASVDPGVSNAWEELYMHKGVRKGLTGPAQFVLIRHDDREAKDIARAMKADLNYYLTEATMFQDLMYMLRTPIALKYAVANKNKLRPTQCN